MFGQESGMGGPDGKERRSGSDRRSGEERREDPAGPPIPVTTERRSGVDRRHSDDRRTGDSITADQLSLGRRLRQPRTLISLILPLFLLVLLYRALPGFHLDQLPALIAQANVWYLLGAFVVFYLGFPLRGWRWALLIRRTGFRLRVRDSTEIIFISWLVNCLVPAKLGDIYRAYLLKLNYGTSISKSFGTIFMERVFDLFAIVLLGLAAGYWSFRKGMSPEVQIVFVIGLVVIAVLAVGLFVVKNFGSKLVRRFPLPERVVEFYDRFEE